MKIEHLPFGVRIHQTEDTNIEGASVSPSVPIAVNGQSGNVQVFLEFSHS